MRLSGRPPINKPLEHMLDQRLSRWNGIQPLAL